MPTTIGGNTDYGPQRRRTSKRGKKRRKMTADDYLRNQQAERKSREKIASKGVAAGQADAAAQRAAARERMLHQNAQGIAKRGGDPDAYMKKYGTPGGDSANKVGPYGTTHGRMSATRERYLRGLGVRVGTENEAADKIALRKRTDAGLAADDLKSRRLDAAGKGGKLTYIDTAGKKLELRPGTGPLKPETAQTYADMMADGVRRRQKVEHETKMEDRQAEQIRGLNHLRAAMMGPRPLGDFGNAALLRGQTPEQSATPANAQAAVGAYGAQPGIMPTSQYEQSQRQGQFRDTAIANAQGRLDTINAQPEPVAEVGLSPADRAIIQDKLNRMGVASGVPGEYMGPNHPQTQQFAASDPEFARALAIVEQRRAAQNASPLGVAGGYTPEQRAASQYIGQTVTGLGGQSQIDIGGQQMPIDNPYGDLLPAQAQAQAREHQMRRFMGEQDRGGMLPADIDRMTAQKFGLEGSATPHTGQMQPGARETLLRQQMTVAPPSAKPQGSMWGGESPQEAMSRRLAESTLKTQQMTRDRAAAEDRRANKPGGEQWNARAPSVAAQTKNFTDDTSYLNTSPRWSALTKSDFADTKVAMTSLNQLLASQPDADSRFQTARSLRESKWYKDLQKSIPIATSRVAMLRKSAVPETQWWVDDTDAYRQALVDMKALVDQASTPRKSGEE